jgi:succinate dehydrogenase / fumarate reductase membrane anchor subunit
MATTTERRPPDAPPGRPAWAGRERPIGGMELWAWLFMRISGLALVLLAVGHVIVVHLLDEGVGRVDFGFVATRWASPLWRTWDWALLVLALVHGVIGLRNIILDYVRPAGVRLALTSAFVLLGFAMFVLGTVVVFTFDASKWPGTF